MAIKYLTRRKIAIFAVCSVALCVALMIIITSLFNGFLSKFEEFWKYEHGQLSLIPGGDITNYSAAADFLEDLPEIDRVRLNVTSGGLLFLGRGDAKMAIIKGIDLKREKRIDQFNNGLILDVGQNSEFKLTDKQIALAEKWLEKKLRRKLTDSDRPINVVPCILSVGLLSDNSSISQEVLYENIADQLNSWQNPSTIFSGTVSNENETRQIKKTQYYCWPINVVEVGTYYIDENTLYLPYEYVVSEFNTKPELVITGTGDISDEKLFEVLEKGWVDYASNILKQSYDDIGMTRLNFHNDEKSWFANFKNEILKQLMIMKVILGFVCLVASVLIFVILMMLIINKRRDIGIIRATGGSRGSIVKLFLNYGLSLGFAGTMLGLIFGFVIVNNIEILENCLSIILGFDIWTAQSYVFSEIPDKVHLGSLWWIIISGIITAGLGATIPAIKAANTEPAESLRFE